MIRLRSSLATLVSLVVLSAVAAGCGGAEKPASPSAMLIDSARAVREQKPVRFAFDTRARADEIVPAGGAGADVGRFSGSELRLEGAYSPEAVRAKGSAAFGGQTLTAEALAGARELYVRFLGQWYGTKEAGLDQLRQQAEQRGGKSSDQAFNEAIASIERYGNQVFEGEVTEGPELDGSPTWQAEGTLNVDGLVRIAQDRGERVTSEDRAVLEKVAQGTRVTYVTGQDDKLPRRVVLALDLRPADFAASARQGSQDLEQVERLRASLTVNMSAWGEEVEIQPPPRFEPIEQLAQRFLGSLMGGGGAVPQQ